MLGLYRYKGPYTWFQRWIACLCGLAACLVRVFTFGYVAADWEIKWFVYLNRKRIDHKWIFNWLRPGPVTEEK